MNDVIKIRQNKYRNNLIEQNRKIKRQIHLMLEFKSFRRIQAILAGIELIPHDTQKLFQLTVGAELSPA
jgi:transposase-like protein